MLRKTACIFLLNLLFTSVAVSQTLPEEPLPESPPEPKITRKVDEFGRLRGDCNLSARLDNFFIELQNSPAETGYILIYSGINELPAEQSYRLLSRLYGNHMRFRKFDPARIVIVEAGYRNEETTEFWMVPPGGSKPEPVDTVELPAIPEHQTYLYDRQNILYYDSPASDFLLQSVIEEREREHAEYLAEQEETADAPGSEIETETATETGPVEEEIAEEPEENFYWLKDSFFSQITDKKDNRGVILFYVDDETFDVNKVWLHIEKAVRKTAKENEIDAGRVTIIFGGYRDGLIAEMWVIPKRGIMPELKPDERLPDEPDIDNN